MGGELTGQSPREHVGEDVVFCVLVAVVVTCCIYVCRNSFYCPHQMDAFYYM